MVFSSGLDRRGGHQWHIRTPAVEEVATAHILTHHINGKRKCVVRPRNIYHISGAPSHPLAMWLNIIPLDGLEFPKQLVQSSIPLIFPPPDVLRVTPAQLDATVSLVRE